MCFFFAEVMDVQNLGARCVTFSLFFFDRRAEIYLFLLDMIVCAIFSCCCESCLCVLRLRS